jgi:hypothetical protein
LTRSSIDQAISSLVLVFKPTEDGWRQSAAYDAVAGVHDEPIVATEFDRWLRARSVPPSDQ